MWLAARLPMLNLQLLYWIGFKLKNLIHHCCFYIYVSLDLVILKYNISCKHGWGPGVFLDTCECLSPRVSTLDWWWGTLGAAGRLLITVREVISRLLGALPSENLFWSKPLSSSVWCDEGYGRWRGDVISSLQLCLLPSGVMKSLDILHFSR